MRRTILLTGVLPFVSAFLGGILAFSLVTAPHATAQASQPAEVRASALTVVNADGTVIGQLAAGPGGGANLTLNDATGTRRMLLGAGGNLSVYDESGTLVFRAGMRTDGSPTSGNPPFNGVELGPGGSIGILPPQR